MGTHDATILDVSDLDAELNTVPDSTIDPTEVFQTDLREIQADLTDVSNSVNNAPETLLLLLEELRKALLDAASNYQSNETNPKILLLRFSYNTIYEFTELLHTHHQYPDLPPKISIEETL